MPAVPTSGSTVLNQNLLASFCLICSEKLLCEVPAGFFFFFLSHPWVTGTNEQKTSTAKFTSMNLYGEFPKRLGEGDAGEVEAEEVLNHSYR